MNKNMKQPRKTKTDVPSWDRQRFFLCGWGYFGDVMFMFELKIK